LLISNKKNGPMKNQLTSILDHPQHTIEEQKEMEQSTVSRFHGCLVQGEPPRQKHSIHYKTPTSLQAQNMVFPQIRYYFPRS